MQWPQAHYITVTARFIVAVTAGSFLRKRQSTKEIDSARENDLACIKRSTMKIPKTRKMYCKWCKTHTAHKVMQVKGGKPSSLKRGSKYRMKLRHRGVGFGNMGRLSKGAMSGWKRYGVKVAKKTNLKYKCEKCNKTQTQRNGVRAKKVEFSEGKT